MKIYGWILGARVPVYIFIMQGHSYAISTGSGHLTCVGLVTMAAVWAGVVEMAGCDWPRVVGVQATGTDA